MGRGETWFWVLARSPRNLWRVRLDFAMSSRKMLCFVLTTNSFFWVEIHTKYEVEK
jgi:hypothetical protein